MTFRHRQRAKEEGRLCSRCNWFISKRRWEAGARLCEGCEDALRGVTGRDADNTSGPYQDEPQDRTGEML